MRKTFSGPRRGSTLLELLVALVVLDLALLSLALMSAVVARRIGDAGRRHRATVAAMNRLERITAQPCAAATSGAGLLEPNVLESWSVIARPLSLEVADSIDLQLRSRDQIVVRMRMPC